MPSIWVILGWALLAAAPITLFAPISGRAGYGLVQGAFYAIISFVAGFVILDKNNAAPGDQTIKWYTYASLGWGIFVILARLFEFSRGGGRTKAERAWNSADPTTPWELSISSAKPIVITYVDRNGQETERTAVPKLLIGTQQDGIASITAVRAYCTRAKAPRTFKTGNIKMIVDPETGEVSSADAWVRGLVQK